MEQLILCRILPPLILKKIIILSDIRVYFARAIVKNVDWVIRFTTEECRKSGDSELRHAMLYFACRVGSLENIKKVISVLGYGEEDSAFTFPQVCRRGNIEIVKYLVSLGADPKTVDGVSIIKASLGNHFEVVEYLLKFETEFLPDSSTYLALNVAARNGNFKVVELLFNRGVFVDGTVINLAKEGGHRRIVQFLTARMVKKTKLVN